MLKKFPVSYPFLNKHGCLITKEEVNKISLDLLTDTSYNEHYGLEIAYALLCSMSHLRNGTKLKALTITLLHMIRKQSLFKEKLKKAGLKDVSVVDDAHSHPGDLELQVLNKVTFEDIVSVEDREKLLGEDRRQKHRALERLREYAKTLKEG